MTPGPDDLGRVNRLYAVLSRVNEEIVRVHEPQELFEAACKIAVEDGGLLLAWIGFLHPDSKYIRWVAKYGVDDGYLDTIRVSVDEAVTEGRGPTGVSLRSGRPFINNDTANNPVMRPWRDEQLKRGYRSSASFPLRSEGATVGVITLYAGEPDYFDHEEIRLLECLADDFSFALESAEVARQRTEAVDELRKSHEELEARVEERTATLERLFAERTEQANHAEALNRINSSLHSSLDVAEIMGRVVIEIAEALEADTTVVQTHMAGYWESAYEHGLRPELRGVRLPDEQMPLSMEVLQTRRPVIVNDVASDGRVKGRLMGQPGITALMAVPLIMRGEVFGILMVNRFGEPRPFGELQLDFLEKAAATLALALENARLYEVEREIAERLQAALISMPDAIAGIEFAHAYHSATEGTTVGGDFYDLFEIGSDRVGITIGDVAGKGLNAAVLTSLIRNTIRAHATDMSKTPNQVIALTNEVVHRATPPEAFATVFFGVLDRRDGRLAYVNAGHTTAAVMRGGMSNEICVGTGPILGGFSGVEFGQCEVCLGTEDMLFLYTDGLTEARRDGEFYGERRLLEFLASAGSNTADVVEDVVGDVIAFSRGALRDDIAILAIRPLGPAADSATTELGALNVQASEFPRPEPSTPTGWSSPVS